MFGTKSCVALVATLLVYCSARAAGPSFDVQKCDIVHIRASSMQCTPGNCLLNDNAYLQCQNLRLWSESMTVSFNEDRSFAGAEALGHVILAQGTSVISCNRIVVGPDRVQGRLEDAELMLKRMPLQLDPEGLPIGKNEAILSGSVLQRVDNERWHADDAIFSLCDCGGEPPSWHLKASSVDATTGKRATAWAPMLWIRPFGLFDMPLTPPLLPLSFPLEKRAFGLLRPSFQFYHLPYPTWDLPIFFPVADAWDVTLAPGLRMDWAKHDLTPPSHWGAFRLGSRTRYTPSESLSGEITTSWTYDRQHFAARLRQISAAESRGLKPPKEFDTTTPDWPLVHRVTVNARQNLHIDDTLDWVTSIRWFSDDLTMQDFAVTIDERPPGYVPSRTALAIRGPYLSATVAADYLQILNNSCYLTNTPCSNVYGAEALTGERGPALSLNLKPLTLAPHLLVDADASLTRYGPWTDKGAPEIVLGANSALAYNRNWGPLRHKNRAGLLGFWINPGKTSEKQSLVTLESRIDATALGTGNILTHMVTPSLHFRAVPWTKRQESSTSRVDERLTFSHVSQLEMALDQGFGVTDPNRFVRSLGLNISQPFDFRDNRFLESRATVDWQILPPLLTGSAVVSGQLTEKPELRELGVDFNVGVGPLTAYATYSRFSSHADRLRRPLYALAASGRDASTPTWIHAMSLGSTLKWQQQVSLTYRTDLLLRRPNEKAIEDLALQTYLRYRPDLTAETIPEGALPPQRPLFNQHRFFLTYRSSCDCWGVTLIVVFPGINTFKQPPAISFLLDLAGVTLGG